MVRILTNTSVHLAERQAAVALCPYNCRPDGRLNNFAMQDPGHRHEAAPCGASIAAAASCLIDWAHS